MDEMSLKTNIRQMETTIREVTEKIRLKTKWINVPKEPKIEPIEEVKAKEEEDIEMMIEEQERMDRMKSVREFKEYCADLLAQKIQERDDTNAELIESMEKDLQYLEGEDAQGYINNALDSGVPKEYIKENLYRPIGLDAVTPESARSEKTTQLNNDIEPGDHATSTRKSLDISSSVIKEPKKSPSSKKIEIVVAHHREALEWLGPFLSHPGVKISIYSTGGKKLPPIFHAHTQYLRDNVDHGVGHTYLYHIVARYDTLQDVTVFCKGDVSERFDYRPERFLVEALNTRDQAPIFFEGQEAEEIDLSDRTDSDESINLIDWSNYSYRSSDQLGVKAETKKPTSQCTRADYYYILMMERLGYKPPGLLTKLALGASFSVTRNKVKKHPKSLWARMLNQPSLDAMGPMEDPNPTTSTISKRLSPTMIEPMTMTDLADAVDPMEIDQI